MYVYNCFIEFAATYVNVDCRSVTRHVRPCVVSSLCLSLRKKNHFPHHTVLPFSMSRPFSFSLFFQRHWHSWYTYAVPTYHTIGKKGYLHHVITVIHSSGFLRFPFSQEFLCRGNNSIVFFFFLIVYLIGSFAIKHNGAEIRTN